MTTSTITTKDTNEVITFTAPAGRDDDNGYSRDGYDWMDAASETGWHTLSNWGKDGWDAGQWPYVMVSLAKTADEHGNLYGMTTYCEGDMVTTFYRSQSEQWKAITAWCHWHWKHSGEQWAAALPEKAEDLDQEIYGRPYGDEYDGKVAA